MLNLSLNDTEELRADKFRKRHKHCELDVSYPWWKRIWNWVLRKPTHKPGPYPSHFSYIIDLGSGIGQGTTVKCNYCGATEDITDYDAW